MFGSGEYGELGVGHVVRNGKKPRGVLRPRLNHLLSANEIGMVQIAVEGMHCVTFSHDHKIFTWGGNDTGTLGRDTTGDGSDDDEDGIYLDPKESTPPAVSSDFFNKDIKFAQVVASDSARFALTVNGSVYGWGTFRVNFNYPLIGASSYYSGSRWHHWLLERRCSRSRGLEKEGNSTNAYSHFWIEANQAPCPRRKSCSSLGPSRQCLYMG